MTDITTPVTEATVYQDVLRHWRERLADGVRVSLQDLVRQTSAELCDALLRLRPSWVYENLSNPHELAWTLFRENLLPELFEDDDYERSTHDNQRGIQYVKAAPARAVATSADAMKATQMALNADTTLKSVPAIHSDSISPPRATVSAKPVGDLLDEACDARDEERTADEATAAIKHGLSLFDDDDVNDDVHDQELVADAVDEDADHDRNHVEQAEATEAAISLDVASAGTPRVQVDSPLAEVFRVEPNLPVHRLACLIPESSADEYTQLKEDMRDHGQRTPAFTWKGELLDGRTRQQVARELGLPLLVQEWPGIGSPLAFVVSLNIKRRHLDVSQRALLAAELKPEFEEEARQRMRAGKANPLANSPQGTTRALAAAQLDVSPRSVEAASQVLKHGSPELVHAVRQRDVSIAAAAELSQLPAPEQRQVLAEGPAAVKAQVRKARRLKAEHRCATKQRNAPAKPTNKADTTTCAVETDSLTISKPTDERERLQLARKLYTFLGAAVCTALGDAWHKATTRAATRDAAADKVATIDKKNTLNSMKKSNSVKATKAANTPNKNNTINKNNTTKREAQSEAKSKKQAGSPWAVAHPGLPQIRTCPIQASGSSGQSFAYATVHRVDHHGGRQWVPLQ